MAGSQHSIQGMVNLPPARVAPTVGAAALGLHSLPQSAPETAGLQRQLLPALWLGSVCLLLHPRLCLSTRTVCDYAPLTGSETFKNPMADSMCAAWAGSKQ